MPLTRNRIPVLVSAVVLLAGVWAGRSIVSAAEPMNQNFPPGAVISLAGTPHLYIADDRGILHWGGDTRALAGHVIDWNTRITVSLDTLKTLQLGDPWLSAGLLKDGTPIYLVKWESNESVPRLLHIQCIRDVELFGINSNNYGNFVLDRDQWEARFRIAVSTLQRGELESTDPGQPCPVSSSGRHQVIQISDADLATLSKTLSTYGLKTSDINLAGTVTVAPLSAGGGLVQAAPLVAAPRQDVGDITSSRGPEVNLGVFKTDKNLNMDSPANTLSRGIYLVRVRTSNNARQVVFVNQNQTITVADRALDARQFSRTLPQPQAILTFMDVCFGWNRTQVCTNPSPIPPDAKRPIADGMNAAVRALGNVLNDDVNVDQTVAEAEGATAINRGQANILAAPTKGLADLLTGGPPPDGTIVGVFSVMDRPIDGPDKVPVGQYAVRSEVGGTQAVLIPADGSPVINLRSVRTLQVRAAPASGNKEPSMTIIANLCLGGGGGSHLCFFGEEAD